MLDRIPCRRRPLYTCLWRALIFAFVSFAATLHGISAATRPTGVPSQVSGVPAPAPAGHATATESSGETLRHAVKGRFLIGAAVGARRLDDPGLAALVARQFDCLTAENEFKPRSLQPQRGKFQFAMADRIVDFAREE